MPRRVISGEKAKNFKGSIKRLLKELKTFRLLIILGLIMAAAGSILAITAPNKLSALIDEISAGLVVNTTNMEKIATEVTTAANEEKIASVMGQILTPDLNNETLASINMSSTISNAEKQEFMNLLTQVNTLEEKDRIKAFQGLSPAILTIILPDITIDNVTISTTDRQELLNMVNDADNITNLNIPVSIASLIFKPIVIDGVTITASDQLTFAQNMATLSKETSAQELYQKLDKMPEAIQKVVAPQFNVTKIKYIVFFLVALYLISALFSYIESISMTVVSNNFAKTLRQRISQKINKLPLKYFDKNQTGDILSRVTNDVDTIAQSMNQSFATLVSAITLFIGTIIMMFVTNWVMALTAIGASLIGFVFMFKVLSKSQKYFVKRQKYLGTLNAHIEEVYSGLNVVKVYNGQEEVNEKFDALNEKVYEANRKSQFLSGLMMPMMNFIGNFGYVAVCIVGALLTMHNYITFGVIVAFMTYVRLFTSPLSQIGQAMTALQTTAAASERVFEFIDEPEMADEKELVKHLDPAAVKGDISFEKVSFTYDGNTKPTIKNFTAQVKAGQKIAIVGPTGAGKTTMVNLLMKFYDINAGDIKIDGVSTKELTRENVHDLFTMVLQDTWIFDGTIKENIIYNRSNVTLKEVKKVCKIVGLDHFIRTLPHGYDSPIKESDSISAGQRQLLTIARGMISDAPFLILDEATSNVDTRTEELVQKAMDKLTEGKTSFIIAHRLSTIKNADLILVIKNGNIVEQGNHDTLMQKKGFYAELYNSQFEL